MSVKVKKEKKHAKWSPSASERWMTCAGSVQLTQSPACPPSEDSEHSLEGTKAHECLELMLKNRKNPKAAKAMALDKYGEEMVEHAEYAIIEIMKWVNEDAELYSEIKADNSHIDPDFWGSLDVAVVEEFGWLTIIDYKYGRGVYVEVKENPQLIAYAISQAKKHNYNFTGVRIGVYQPRYECEDGVARYWETDIKTLKTWEKKFASAIERASEPNAPLVYGEKHCFFCPAKTICPEIRDEALKKAQVAFDDDTCEITTPLDAGIEPARLPMLSPEKIGRILDGLERFDMYATAMRKLAHTRLETGHKITGWKLVEKRASRKWLDAKKAEERARFLFGTDAFEPTYLKSPAQLEKVSPKAKSFVEKNAAMVSSGLTMVREDDSRIEKTPLALAFPDVKDKGNNGSKTKKGKTR